MPFFLPYFLHHQTKARNIKMFFFSATATPSCHKRYSGKKTGMQFSRLLRRSSILQHRWLNDTAYNSLFSPAAPLETERQPVEMQIGGGKSFPSLRQRKCTEGFSAPVFRRPLSLAMRRGKEERRKLPFSQIGKFPIRSRSLLQKETYFRPKTQRER